MSTYTSVTFEIQENGDNYSPRLKGRIHEWMNVGGRDGRYYFTSDNYLDTKGIKTVDEAHKTIKKIQRGMERQYMKPPTMRIVRVEVVKTYDVVE